jgi:hypothetical protein
MGGAAGEDAGVESGELEAAAADLKCALDAAHVNSRISVDPRGWIDVQLWAVRDTGPAPGLIAALRKVDDYLVSNQGLVSASVYPAQAHWLAEGLHRLVASGRAPC